LLKVVRPAGIAPPGASKIANTWNVLLVTMFLRTTNMSSGCDAVMFQRRIAPWPTTSK
jgi:hypothetical protein